ncbi:IMPACT family protein [Rhodohalobacter sp. 8-1]|uniref:IMPACT family protein n=1 Tax=Rhodohalobacter sp. 8-1 TaxID=3131972 RepID=UPI0030EB88FA
MLTVTQHYQAEYRVKGSKFLSFINPCDTTEEAEIRLSKIRDLHPTATHHCYAFRVDPSSISEHSQDDGEPSGTAGMPILNAMRSANIVDAIVVVVRYYGGTKLGKSGLIDAYGKAAEFVINQSILKPIVATRRFVITYPYDQQSLIDKLYHSFTLFEIESEYTENVKLVIECPEKELPVFEEHLKGLQHLLMNIEKGNASSHILT